jgi:hypothetical protein
VENVGNREQYKWRQTEGDWESEVCVGKAPSDGGQRGPEQPIDREMICFGESDAKRQSKKGHVSRDSTATQRPSSSRAVAFDLHWQMKVDPQALGGGKGIEPGPTSKAHKNYENNTVSYETTY